MRPTPGILKLPSKIVSELEGHDLPPGRRRGRDDLNFREDRYRIKRAQRKANGNDEKLVFRAGNNHVHAESSKFTIDRTSPPEPVLKSPEQLKMTKETAKFSSSSPLPQRKLSRALAAKLAQDDAEIAALERKLGIKSKKRIPKAFQDEDLDELLNDIDGGNDDNVRNSEGKHDKHKAWLAPKRQQTKNFSDKEEEEYGIGNQTVASGKLHETKDFPHSLQGGYYDFDDADILPHFDDESKGLTTDHDEASAPIPSRAGRIEVHSIPNIIEYGPKPAKYIPPSLRTSSFSETEALTYLRRQTQGLINRLTEANLITILSGIESLYRDNARQHVTSTLVDILLTSVCQPTSLPDTLVILPAGFIAAIYKVIGIDFAAELIKQIIELFDWHYAKVADNSAVTPTDPPLENSKETTNLVTLLAELYNFQVIGSNLIFDYIRRFLTSLSPVNAELLLRIIRISGPRLRQDDSSSLKDIVNIIRPVLAGTGIKNISVRTRFLIESIYHLKNSRMKTGISISTISSEHTIRMKKLLRTLNARSLKGSEPLRIGLKDFYNSDKKGKWWLIGASWADSDGFSKENANSTLIDLQGANCHSSPRTNGYKRDFVQLARDQRMNTDIRRAIFVTLISASDHQDAYIRLMKLKLKKVQELEIPKILIHCSGAEISYNPYYTLIAQKLCGEKRLKMAFQFGLWDIFRRLGENKEDDNGEVNTAEEDNYGDFQDSRQLVNIAKMFGTLIVSGSMQFNVLKNLKLSSLQPRTQTLIEVLCITVLVQLQKHSQEGQDEELFVKVFSNLKNMPHIMISLRHFLKKVVAKTDIVGDEADKVKVKIGCKVATNVLGSLLAANTEDI